MRPRLAIVAVLVVGWFSFAAQSTADVPASAVVLDPDIVWDRTNPNSFALSPDGKQIAYVSKGALWLCAVDVGPSKQLADLPNTLTAILAEPDNQQQRDLSATQPYTQGDHIFTGPKYALRDVVVSLSWAPNQDGVYFTVAKRPKENTMVTTYMVMHATTSGVVTEVAAIEGDFGPPQQYKTWFHVTPDREHVVVCAYHPFIWSVATARPIATPYDLLEASSTSGRFLGIEIDTRQLVVVDERLRVAKRIDVEFPSNRMVDLTWSADERFAICRVRDEGPAWSATAFRFDLATNNKTELGRCDLRDQFVFLNGEGRLLMLCNSSAYASNTGQGSRRPRIAVVATDGSVRDVCTSKGYRMAAKDQRGTASPPILASADGTTVAIAVPRPSTDSPGGHYHLVDLDGAARPFLPVNDSSYITPYYPIAFAEGGRRLIARSGSTLFSLPVSEVATESEASDVD